MWSLAVTTLVTTSTACSPSNPSKEPRNLDALDAPGSIYARRPRLRALWTEWSVEVRVLSGALGKPPHRAAFFMLGLDRPDIRHRGYWQRAVGTRDERPPSPRWPGRTPARRGWPQLLQTVQIRGGRARRGCRAKRAPPTDFATDPDHSLRAGSKGVSSGAARSSSTSGASRLAVAGASVTPSIPCPVAR